jgi:hypothetical protein
MLGNHRMRPDKEGIRVTVVESIDRYVPLTDSGTGRLLWTQVQRDGWGNPELFVLVYAARSVLRHKGYPDNARIPQRDRKTEPFLRIWKEAMSHWASGNCDALTSSLAGRNREFVRISSSRHTRDCVSATPSPPGRPEFIIRYIADSRTPPCPPQAPYS